MARNDVIAPARDDAPPEVHALPGNETVAAAVAVALGTAVLPVSVDEFPDGEVRVRLSGASRSRREAIVVCSLEHPNEKILPLIFTAGALHARGARHVGLIAPYLAYMRQDRAFNVGEAVSAIHFAQVVSKSVDWLVTVEPHLHRITRLDTVYSIPVRAVQVRDRIAAWIAEHVTNGVIIGPDAESRQWVSDVAARAGLPFEVLVKQRLSPTQVVVSIPRLEERRDCTPVLVDDVISTGHTMLEAVQHLRDIGAPRPVCVAVHALFSADAYQALIAAGVERVVTTTTIAHPSNAIDVSGSISDAVLSMLRRVQNAALHQ